jgi:hypothetical protein
VTRLLVFSSRISRFIKVIRCRLEKADWIDWNCYREEAKGRGTLLVSKLYYIPRARVALPSSPGSSTRSSAALSVVVTHYLRVTPYTSKPRPPDRPADRRPLIALHGTHLMH